MEPDIRAKRKNGRKKRYLLKATVMISLLKRRNNRVMLICIRTANTIGNIYADIIGVMLRLKK